jgi:sigma-B regulation protein RsbU (phosphoserine phosphatase)
MVLNHFKWWVVIILVACGIYYLFPTNISSIIPEKLNRYEVENISRQYLSQNHIDVSKYQAIVLRQIDYTIIAYLKSELGQEKTEQIIYDDRIPNLGWSVRFLKNIPTDQPQTRYHVWVSPFGKITGFNRSLPDTLTLESLIEARALAVARMFISQKTDIDLSKFIFKRSQQNRQVNRTDYEFVWGKSSPFSTGKFELSITVQGTEIGGYRYRFMLPENVQSIISQKVTESTFLYIIQIIGLIIIFIFALILFLKKYHEGEVSISLGRNLFLIFFFLGLIRTINELPVLGASVFVGNLSYRNIQIISFMYEALIQNVFLGILLLASWAVGEAYARTLWPKKLNSIDSVLNKHFFTLSTGNAMLRGGAIGFFLALVYLIVFSLITGKDSHIFQIYLPFGDTFQYYVPAISIVLASIMIALISETVFRFFIINVVHNRWQKKWLSIIISSVVWIVGYFIVSNMPILSMYSLNLIFALLTGVLLSWLYFKYDLLTLISINAAVHIVFFSFPLLVSSNDWHQLSASLLLLILLIPVGQIMISFIKKDTFQYEYSGLPKHIRRISERERMRKELEIARNVQMGLLPKENPNISGFDISGLCKPAKEVGGDYFDFVYLSKNKLGIAIGDVSGKGVPAAIYMTLTKGILQSHADENISPKIVLNKVNKLLYRNIERNSFVSMFYAILDINERTLTFARAGHNPGIMINQRDGASRLLTTDGIALGLEEGTVFDKTLKEHTIKLNRGDALIFYTDGFTEAMNTRLEEYGEEAFLEIISKNSHLPTTELIRKIISEIEKFTNEAQQHDDMTIVIIKVL